MPTRTISVREEAYSRLVRARVAPNESFSDVILRARWDAMPILAGEYLELVKERGPVYPEAALEEIAKVKRADRPPKDKWRKG